MLLKVMKQLDMLRRIKVKTRINVVESDETT